MLFLFVFLTHEVGGAEGDEEQSAVAEGCLHIVIAAVSAGQAQKRGAAITAACSVVFLVADGTISKKASLGECAKAQTEDDCDG